LYVFVCTVILFQVHIGLPSEDEELNDRGQVLHVGPTGITVSWKGRDLQSGILKYYVAIGTSPGDTSVTDGFRDLGTHTIFHFANIALEVTDESGLLYYVSVKATNGAGAASLGYLASKAIKVLKANIPGVIFDGRQQLIDDDITQDDTAVAMTFDGFQSEACAIVRYEWAIGSSPFLSDIQTYTMYGIVMHNVTYGQSQIHLKLYDDSTHFITVRAKTGYKCHEDYIVATSDGMTVDTQPPRIAPPHPAADNAEGYSDWRGMFYQSFTDTLDLVWNASDHSGMTDLGVRVGSLPLTDTILLRMESLIDQSSTYELSPGAVQVHAGQFVFVSVDGTDEGGNVKVVVSHPVAADISPPAIHNLSCTQILSVEASVLRCTWDALEEDESHLAAVKMGIGSQGDLDDLIPFSNIDVGRLQWTQDLRHLLYANNETSSVFMTIWLQNVLNQTGLHTHSSLIDRTAPLPGIVKFVTTLNGTEGISDLICQIPTTYVEVYLDGADDPESGVDQ
jgi:hypothetical protein